MTPATGADERGRSSESVSLRHYVVAFIDLLGQQDHLRNLRALPSNDNPTEIDAARNVLRHTFGAVQAIRRMFRDSFAAFDRAKASRDTSALTEAQKSQLSELQSHPIQFYGFSDSVVAFLSLTTTTTAKLPARGIYAILAAAGLTFHWALSEGHPIRGGIDVGLGMEPGPNEIYGPVLSRVHTLESAVAGYPRIVIGDELVAYLNALNNDHSDEPLSRASRFVAKRCADCLAVDDDGMSFLDYLGPNFRGVVQDTSVVARAREQVLRFSEQYKQTKNTKLAFRYTLLRNYFDYRWPLWKDK